MRNRLLHAHGSKQFPSRNSLTHSARRSGTVTMVTLLWTSSFDFLGGGPTGDALHRRLGLSTPFFSTGGPQPSPGPSPGEVIPVSASPGSFAFRAAREESRGSPTTIQTRARAIRFRLTRAPAPTSTRYFRVRRGGVASRRRPLLSRGTGRFNWWAVRIAAFYRRRRRRRLADQIFVLNAACGGLKLIGSVFAGGIGDNRTPVRLL
jgi:hypothetical protein